MTKRNKIIARLLEWADKFDVGTFKIESYEGRSTIYFIYYESELMVEIHPETNSIEWVFDDEYAERTLGPDEMREAACLCDMVQEIFNEE